MLSIRTERLLIRDYTMDDIRSLHSLMSNPGTMKYLDRMHTSVDESMIYLENIIQFQVPDNRHTYKMAVLRKSDNNYIGTVALNIETDAIVDGRAELSYYFLPEAWGCGYATEAGKAMVEFGFRKLILHKISAGCLKSNIGSEKVMINCGMTKEAEYIDHCLREGQWVNRVEYAIISHNYSSNE